MRQNQYLVHYQPIKTAEPLEAGESKELKITLDYTLGGINIWNGGTTERGLKLYIKQVTIKQENGYKSECYVPTDKTNYTIHALTLKAKNEKKGKALAELIRLNLDRIIAEYHNDNPRGVYDIVKELAGRV